MNRKAKVANHGGCPIFRVIAVRLLTVNWTEHASITGPTELGSYSTDVLTYPFVIIFTKVYCGG